MRKDAEEHADEDAKRKDLIEARNQADNTAYGAEKAIKDLGEKLPDEVKTEVKEAVAEVRKVLESEDVEEIKKATEALTEVVQKIGASVYEEPQAEASAEDGEADEEAAPDEDVVEGEAEEV